MVGRSRGSIGGLLSCMSLVISLLLSLVLRGETDFDWRSVGEELDFSSVSLSCLSLELSLIVSLILNR